MGYTLPSACIPSGNMAAMISPTSLPNAAPVGHTQTQQEVIRLLMQEKSSESSSAELPIRKTGMKAPHGTGMVVATADIQNWNTGEKIRLIEKCTINKKKQDSKAYLHDDEEDKCDEDVDLRVFPGVVVADVVKLLGHALTAPRAVVKQRNQRLVLCQLTGRHESLNLNVCVYLNM